MHALSRCLVEGRIRLEAIGGILFDLEVRFETTWAYIQPSFTLLLWKGRVELANAIVMHLDN